MTTVKRHWRLCLFGLTLMMVAGGVLEGHNATAADSISRITPELISAPKTTGCDMQGGALKTELANITATLLAPEGSQ